jgi:beta-lactamase regulating signal transducer with metallopeptidase domain
MTYLVECTIKISMILVVALLTARVLRRCSASVRHMALASALLCVGILPFAALVLPAWNIAVSIDRVLMGQEFSGTLVQSIVAAVDNHALALPASAPMPLLQPLVILVWLAGLIAGLVVLVTGFVRLARVTFFSAVAADGPWSCRAEAITKQFGLHRRIRLLQSRNPSMLVTWGLFRPRILLPAGSEVWPEERIHAVLLHEIAHVRRMDWLVQCVSELVRLVFWFNPLVWIACRQLRMESEFACDDTVLAQGIPATEYAGHLLDVVRAMQQSDRAWSVALGTARPSTIERRFTAMLNSDNDRRPIDRLTMATIAVAAFSIALPIAAIRASAAAQIAATPSVLSVHRALSESPARALKSASLPSPQPQNAAPGPTATRSQTPQSVGADNAAAGLLVDPVDIDFKDADIREFFRLIARQSGLNVVVDPDVSGLLTINLKNVPWDRALNVVLLSHGLVGQLRENVLRISRRTVDLIRMDFEIYINGVPVGQPRIATADKKTAILRQKDVSGEIFELSVSPTRTGVDKIEIDFAFTLGDTSFSGNALAVSLQAPGRVSWRSPSGTDSFEVRIALAPNP